MSNIISGAALGEEVRRKAAELAKQVYIDDEGFIHLNLQSNYQFKMERCDSPVKLLDWVVHLNRKTWMTPEALDRFILLACHYHDIKLTDA